MHINSFSVAFERHSSGWGIACRTPEAKGAAKACRLEQYNDCICAYGLLLNTGEDRVLDLVNGSFALWRAGDSLDKTLS